jgi:uncharacterized protein YggT (Ycf19 family)
MNYTVGVGGYHPPRGLLNRLTSPELEWVRYRAIDQFKILLMAILPLAVCAYWARGFRLSKSTFMEFNFISGLAAVLMAFNYWYFWLHHRMWIRHFVPSLCMGLWVVVFFVVVRWRGSDRFSQWGRLIVTVILSLIVGREALKVPNFLAMVRDPSYSVRYSKICSVSNPLEATNLEILNACQLGDLGFR